MRPNGLREIGMQTVKVQKLVSLKRSLEPGPERKRLEKAVTTAKGTLNAAVRSWRRRNEG